MNRDDPSGKPHLDTFISDPRFTRRQRTMLVRLLHGNTTRLSIATLRNLRTGGLIIPHLAKLTALGRELAEHFANLID